MVTFWRYIAIIFALTSTLSYGQGGSIGIISSGMQAGGFTGVLDDYTGATHAYSLRLTNSSYTGNAISISRASDSATMGIGFSGEDLDVAAINTFCSGTTCYVDTLYDQVGSTNLASIYGSTSVIYESGAVTTQNGKSAIKMYGDYFFTFSEEYSDFVTSSQNYNISVSNYDGVSDASPFSIGENGVDGSGNGFGASAGTTYNDGSVYTYDFAYGGSAGTYIAESVYASSSSLNMYLNGTAITPTLSQNGSFSPSGTTTFIVGSGSEYFQEMLNWNTDQSSNRSGIYSNVSTYW